MRHFFLFFVLTFFFPFSVTTNETEEDILIQELKEILRVDDWPTFNNFEEFVIEHQLLRHKVASLLVTKYKYGHHKVVPAWMLFGGALCDPKSPLYSYSFKPLTKRLPIGVCKGNWLEKGNVVDPTKPFNSSIPLGSSKFDLLASHKSCFAIWLSKNNIFDGILEEHIVDNSTQRRKSTQRIAWLWIDTKFSELSPPSTINNDKEWKDLLSKLEGVKEKVPDREHILMVVSNRNVSESLIEKISNKSVLLVSRTGDRLQWLLSPACARLYLHEK